MIVLFTGSRVWQDERAMWAKFRAVPPAPAPEGTQHELRHGANGNADLMAARFAGELGWKVTPFYADWRRFGNAAGPIRNTKMVVSDPTADVCWAAPLPGSIGTPDCMTKAEAYGIPVELIQEGDR